MAPQTQPSSYPTKRRRAHALAAQDGALPSHDDSPFTCDYGPRTRKDTRRHPSDRIAFITSNVNDFCDNASKLHPDLIQVLTDSGLPLDYVTVFTTLQTFVDKEVLPRLPTPHKTFVDFTAKSWPAFRLTESLLHLMEDKLQHLEVSAHDIGQPSYCENPTIRGVYEPGDVEILSERRTKDKQRMVEIRASVECYLDCYIEKSEYWCLDPDERPSAEDWNETFMEADFEQVLEIEGYATFDEKKGNFVDFEVTDIRGERPKPRESRRHPRENELADDADM